MGVSPPAHRAVEMLATMVVLQLPPSESSRRRVSFESRYGTWLALGLGFGLGLGLGLGVALGEGEGEGEGEGRGEGEGEGAARGGWASSGRARR